jgi:xanthine dehydrogenase accessory factor
MITPKLAALMVELGSERSPFVIATVVRARRPTSVRPGDSAIVRTDGTIHGFVGGQCAESSVRLYSLRALETGEPLLLRLIPGDAEDLEPADGIEGAIVERNPCLSGGSLEIFLEPQLPAPRLVIVGGSPIAEALEQLGSAAGYAADRVGADDVGDVAGAAAVVIASHGSDEERILDTALSAGVPYVALVASIARGRAVREALEVPAELAEQLHTPAGLDIGARTPAEIAISILAEMVARHHADPTLVRTAPAPAAETVAVDPVCGMQVAISESTPHLDVAGERVYFCGSGCREAYAALHATDGPAA